MEGHKIRRLYSDGSITVVSGGVHKAPPDKYETDYKRIGSEKKTFLMSGAVARQIRSAAVKQFNTKKFSIHFLTLTFPKKINQHDANNFLHKFLDNLTKNYKLQSYVCVKELHKSGNPHYHCLFDLPWTDYRKLNKAWNSVYKGSISFSKNALTRGKFPIVRNIKGVAKYITKYVSKGVWEKNNPEGSETRVYFLSRSVIDKGRVLSELEYYFLMNTKYGLHAKFFVNDYCMLIRLKDFWFSPDDFLHKFVGSKLKKPPPKPEKVQKSTDLISPNVLF